MAWPLPLPEEIADRLASGFESELLPIAGPEGVDARSPRSPLTALGRVQAAGAWGLYQHQARIMKELFPDSAVDELARHGDVWGVPRRPAAAASGSVTFANAGVDDLELPSELTFQLGDLAVMTTEGGTIEAEGTLTVTAEVLTVGAAGNFPTGTVLPLSTPFPGLASQSAIVEAPGFAGGLDIEDPEAWRLRILDRIRSGPFYGQTGAYEDVALAVPGVTAAREYSPWVGLGTVGVIVAMGTLAAPAVPSPTQLELVQAALDAARPITATVYAVAVVLHEINITLHVEPDTTPVRAAVAASIALFLALEPGIGGTLALSRLSEAIASASGEFSHRIDLPAADVVLGATELAVLGDITWAPS